MANSLPWFDIFMQYRCQKELSRRWRYLVRCIWSSFISCCGLMHLSCCARAHRDHESLEYRRVYAVKCNESARRSLLLMNKPMTSTPCPKKTCDYIFYNNFNNKCPITIIFGIVSSKSMSHRKLVLFPTSPI